MTSRELERLDRQLEKFMEPMLKGMGRPERRRAMECYITGLLLDGERKSMEPMAARLVKSAAEIEGMRQRLQQCIAHSDWSEAELYRRLARRFEEQASKLEAFVVDDTGFGKQGEHSVGVGKQYSGTLGYTSNCQVAVSLHMASSQSSGCIGMRIYLPEDWASDRDRRRKAGVPEHIAFERKWEISLGLLDQALEWGVAKRVVLADAGYGDSSDFREGLRRRGLPYVVGVQGKLNVWPPGSNPRVPPPSRVGRPPARYLDQGRRPISIARVAQTLSYRTVSWRSGEKSKRSRFAAARVRPHPNYHYAGPPASELWLLCEWPIGEPAPTRYWFAALPASTSLKELVRLAKLRWRVERDYQELKEEIGLDHFEGRSWRGFHHHVALCAVAHAFLVLNRAISPSALCEMDIAANSQSLTGHPSQTTW